MLDETSILDLAHVRRRVAEVYDEAVEAGAIGAQTRLSDVIDALDTATDVVRAHLGRREGHDTQKGHTDG